MEGSATLALDPEAINRYVAEQILESGIGKALREVIDAEIKKIKASYNNPIEPIIQKFIAAEIQRYVTDEKADELKALVAEHLTPEVVTSIFTKMWEAWGRNF